MICKRQSMFYKVQLILFRRQQSKGAKKVLDIIFQMSWS